jgi:hypothetical protein
MAAEKRDFVNFNDFPGHLDAETGMYEFPELKHKDTKNRTRTWQIFVRLVKDTNRQSGIDWDPLEEKQVPIKDTYYLVGDSYTNLPANVIAEVYVETGIQGSKITRHAPTYVTDCAFEDQTNQRNQFQQALIIARNLYLKRKRNSSTKIRVKDTSKGTVMYFPMLAARYKEGIKHIKYPIYIQPKLDGLRCITFLLKKDGGPQSVIMYSRTKHMFPVMPYLQNALYNYLNALFDEEKNQSIYLDGELYKHGKSLQEISGDSRSGKRHDNGNANEYHLYDCFYPLELNTMYESRKEQLDVLFQAIRNNSDPRLQYIKQVDTVLCKDEQETQAQFDKYVNLGYEGIMLRNLDGVYLANYNDNSGNKLRSKDLVKMKEKYSAEYEIVGFTEGKKGKDKGAIIWIAQTTDGHRFNCTPKNISYQERYRLYDECLKSFDNVYLGRMMTVEYESLSTIGIPQRAKAVAFRDYE